MILTYLYRLLATKQQHRALEAILESQRQLYNAALEERIDAYRKARVSRTFFDQSKALTEWRQSDPDARNLPRRLQITTLKRLDDAYRAYFRRVERGEKPGFPRFRGKGRFDSFGFLNFSKVSFRDGRIRFQGMPGSLRIHFHRPIPVEGVIKNCNFRRTVKGWHVSFAVELPMPLLRDGKRAVGVDLGITTFAAFSDGGFIPSLQAARRAERRLRILQRALERKKQVIALEDLNIQSLARSCRAKEVLDASWGRFITMLHYKAERAGVRIVVVDADGTSQICSGCGKVVQKTLGDRLHECPQCGLFVDRDLNAAVNILNRAGVGPGLPNVADHCMRAGGNLSTASGSLESN